ncbi:hypothetical protein ABT120_12975 [Nonomuraea angiospora]|uniref:hypothetical protein n=1 Tax=Nonomuraea angiospora TaxID=46172 RepID=UPI00331A3B48
MATNETYRAIADVTRVKMLADTESPLVEVEFLSGLPETQKAAFKGAADRWVQIILGDLPEMRMPGLAAIDDLRVMAGHAHPRSPRDTRRRRAAGDVLQDLGYQVDLEPAETFLLPETPPSTAKTVFTCAVDHYPRCTSTIR